jgi:cobalt-zinc-cadmium resistance protein CzcA
LPKTEFGLEYGQTNSIADNDTRFSVSQTFAFPTLYGSQNKLAKTKIEASELNEAVLKNELIAQVKSIYYELWYLKSKQTLLQKQDSIYERFAYAANLRYKTGESNALEQATANVELADIGIMILENAAVLKNHQLLLQNLMNTDSLVDINVGNLQVKTAMLPETKDSTAIANNPMLGFYQKQIELAENEKSVAVSKLLPDITLGYFNQSFIGSGETADGMPTVFDSGDRFTGVQLGLSIPIWFKPHTSKIKAAKIQRMENEAQLEAVKNKVQTQLGTLWETLQTEQANLESYRSNALPQAELLLKNSQRGFEEGEIGYVEYVQGLNRALSIQIKYLDFVNQYNQTLIKIEQLIANNQ